MVFTQRKNCVYIIDDAVISEMPHGVYTISAEQQEAVAAQRVIRSTLLALARSIRRPGCYVGYSAFILFALLKKCRPCAWEGNEKVDLLKVFAPWAIQECNAICAVHAIPCAIAVSQDNKLELKAISEQYPLSRCVHFVGGVDIPPAAVAAVNPDLEGM